MFRSIPDVEFFQHKLDRMFEEVLSRDSNTFDIFELGKKIGLEETEIESMYWHLKRGDMIEKDDDSARLRFSCYGMMLQTGQIQEAYAPI